MIYHFKGNIYIQNVFSNMSFYMLSSKWTLIWQVVNGGIESLKSLLSVDNEWLQKISIKASCSLQCVCDELHLITDIKSTAHTSVIPIEVVLGIEVYVLSQSQ